MSRAPTFGQVHSARYVGSLLIASMIPVILFGLWTAYLTAERERGDARRQVALVVSRVARQVSSELSKELEVAGALANSMHLDERNFPAFYEEATRLTAQRPLWEGVSLVAPTGTPLLNIRRPVTRTLGPPVSDDTLAEVVSRAEPAIGDLGPPGPITGKRLVPMKVPVIRSGTVLYVLQVELSPDALGLVLRDSGAPRDWIGAIVDGTGIIVARTGTEPEKLGQRASSGARVAIERGAEGFYKGETLDGIQVETVFKKLPLPEKWSVHFGIPTEVLNGPVTRSLRWLVAGGAASLVLAGGLGLVIARDLGQRRSEQVQRAQLELQLSEARRLVAIDAAELGTWRWDPGRNEATGSERTRMLMAFPVSDETEGLRCTPVEFLTAFHPLDRDTLQEAISRCLTDLAPLKLELRVSGGDGRIRWLMIHGKCPQVEPRTERVIHGVLSNIDPQKQAEAERFRLARALADAQEGEQRRIARDLHDQVGQTLTGLSIGLKGAAQMIDGDCARTQVIEHLVWLQELTNTVGRDIHRVASDLRPSAIDDFGLEGAIRAELPEWTRGAELESDLQVVGPPRRLPLPVETAGFRIVQEAVTNVMKHASATNVSVVLQFRESSLRVVIEDDGAGFDSEQASRQAAEAGGSPSRAPLGLAGMRERALALGGSLTIESSPGVGTTVFAELPAAEAD